MSFLTGVAAALNEEAREACIDVDQEAHDRLVYLIADVLDARDALAGI